MINIDKSKLQCKNCNFSYRAEIAEMRNRQQSTTEGEAPEWFRRWTKEREEKEAKRKAGRAKRAFSKLVAMFKHDFEVMKRIKRKIISWVFSKSVDFVG